MMLQVGDDMLPSSIGTISIRHYKDPYYPYCFFLCWALWSKYHGWAVLH